MLATVKSLAASSVNCLAHLTRVAVVAPVSVLSLAACDGWLRLFAQLGRADLALTPNLLLQKFPAREFAVETLVEFSPQQEGDEAGLVVMGDRHAALALRHTGAGTQVVFRTNGRAELLGELPAGKARLRVEVAEGGLCQFSLVYDDGSLLIVPEKFQAYAGRWLGAKVGIYCASAEGKNSDGHADFDCFRFAQTVPSV